MPAAGQRGDASSTPSQYNRPSTRTVGLPESGRCRSSNLCPWADRPTEVGDCRCRGGPYRRGGRGGCGGGQWRRCGGGSRRRVSGAGGADQRHNGRDHQNLFTWRRLDAPGVSNQNPQADREPTSPAGSRRIRPVASTFRWSWSRPTSRQTGPHRRPRPRSDPGAGLVPPDDHPGTPGLRRRSQQSRVDGPR